MWQTDSPVSIGFGYAVDSAYGAYHVTRSEGTIIGSVDPSYYQRRVDVLAAAKEIAAADRKGNA